MTTLKTILYFSIFNYPITRDEIYKFSCSKDMTNIDEEIELLLKKGIIYRIDDFYLKNNSPEFVKSRLLGNKMASKIMPKALKMSKRIAIFPYVRGVALSGGLSKGYFDDNGDIDFFIITKSNRLWIARTLLILYKKIVLLNSKKYFCVNYFVGSNNLTISEQNKFTAMELVTLIPTFGDKVFKTFIEKNLWVKSYFPNKNIEENFKFLAEIKKPLISKFIEFVLDSRFGDFIDLSFRKITMLKWKRKFKNLSSDDFKIAMKSTKNVSKHHPNNYQRKVIDKLNDNYFQVKKKHEINLELEHA